MRNGMRMVSGLILITTIVGSIWSYAHLPPNVISHWDANGQPNGTMPRAIAVSFVPMLMLVLMGLFFVLPGAEPNPSARNDARHLGDQFSVTLLLFLGYVHLLSLVWNLGASFSFTRWLTPALAFLFIDIGRLLRHAKQNWFFGIRTPWTLSNEDVWNQTHAHGATAFQLAGVCALGGMLVPPSVAIWMILIPICMASFYTVILSYVLFRRVSSPPVKPVQKS